jgi:hypothetical protein
MRVGVAAAGEFVSKFMRVHCKENPIYVLPEMKLRGLVPNFLIHVQFLGIFVSILWFSVFAMYSCTFSTTLRALV